MAEREVQGGDNGSPPVRAAAVGARRVLENRDACGPAAEDRRAAGADASRRSQVLRAWRSDALRRQRTRPIHGKNNTRFPHFFFSLISDCDTFT